MTNKINKNLIDNGYQAFLAPAKINLFLHVVGRRDDGYHALQTVFQLLDFYDTIYLKTNADGAISRMQEVAGISEADDLCVRAAHALKEMALKEYALKKHVPQQTTSLSMDPAMLGVDIAYDKRIAMGGGLGGGSSDAATVLVALNQRWQLNLSRQTLMDIGLKLGADVPVFVFGQNAWAEGVGEILQKINTHKINANPNNKPTYYVVLTPQVHVATADIFKAFSNRLNSHANSKISLTKHTNPMTMADFSGSPDSNLWHNDLEPTVCEKHPQVADTLNWLNQFGLARMSGSGSSVFIALDNRDAAQLILQQMPRNTTGFVAKGLDVHPLFGMTIS